MEYKELEQNRIKEKEVLQSLQNANIAGEKCKYSEEQILEAQKEKTKEQINFVYENKIFPSINSIIYLIYYVTTLIVLPILFVGKIKDAVYGAVIGYVLLISIVLVIKKVENKIKKDITKEYYLIDCLEKFSSETSIYTYLLTSIGYMLVILDSFSFYFIYLIMVFIFLIVFYYDVIKPIIKKRKCIN